MRVKRIYLLFFSALVSLTGSIQAGALQDVYQATFDMHDQFQGTTTTIQASAAAIEVALAGATSSLSLDMFQITGTAQMMSADIVPLTSKAAIDNLNLTIIELLKTILYKLSSVS